MNLIPPIESWMNFASEVPKDSQCNLVYILLFFLLILALFSQCPYILKARKSVVSMQKCAQ